MADYIIKGTPKQKVLSTFEFIKLEKEEAKELLRRYRQGKCTERELKIVDRWYNSFDDADIKLPPNSRLNAIKAEMLENIKSQIARDEMSVSRRVSEKLPVKASMFSFAILKRIAAVLVIGFGIGFFFYNQNKTPRVLTQQSVEETPQPKVLPSVIFLSDGSKVKLKEGSKLIYPTTFVGQTREVTLIGEAFFDIARDEQKPFLIHAGNITTRVLGTSFNIKAYAEEESSEVSVVSGKVSVSVNGEGNGNAKEVILAPNQKAVYSKNEKVLVQRESTEKMQTETEKRAKLVFNETSLEEIVDVLNAYYDVNIRLENQKMNGCLITAELTDEPVEVSLTIITKAIGAEYKISEDEIIVSGAPCGNEK